MRTEPQCIPCLVGQAIDTIERCAVDPVVRDGYIREILLAATALDFSRPPPALAGELQRQLRDITGCADPYGPAKARHNELARELLPPLAAAVRQSADRLGAAVRLSLAGNMIDLGARRGLSDAEVRAVAEGARCGRVVGDLAAFRRAVTRAERILFLADNAGEIVFDRPLIELLPAGRVTVVVRGSPVLNDATREDAISAGLPAVASLMDNGSCIPGTVPAECSPEFRERFAAADLIIAKGQGNFETLAGLDAPLFCLFRVKCSLVAAHCGHPVGSQVVWSAAARLHPARRPPARETRHPTARPSPSPA